MVECSMPQLLVCSERVLHEWSPVSELLGDETRAAYFIRWEPHCQQLIATDR